MSNMKKNSALIYEGTYQAINYIPDADAQLEAYRGIIEYGLYGTEPHSENPFVNMVYVQAIPYLNKARERYQKAVESGKKGGRPTQIDKERVQELKENGLSLKEIAAELGVPENTVKSILYREGAKGAKGMQRGANLNDNVNDKVNDNVNVNVNDNENVNEKENDTVHENEKENGIEVGDDFPFNDDEGEDFDGNPVFDRYGSTDNPVQYDDFSSGEEIEDGDLPF